MGDESWIYGYDPETKQHPSQWKSKKGMAGPEFSKEHAHCFFRCERDCSPLICSS
jgi:hypothetical protein